MMTTIRQRMAKEDKGFTLIELLVVMIIIGILAAIAIPIFLSQRAKAQDSAAKADVSTLGKEIATYFVDGTAMPDVDLAGTTPEHYTVDGVDVGKQSTNVVLGGILPAAGTANAETSWCVSVYNLSGDVAKTKGYKYSAVGGLEEGLCTGTVPTS